MPSAPTPQPKTVTPDVSEYLFFSPNTKGLSGSPVKIRADLFVDFFCNVDPETHDGQSVIRDIESLKIFGKTAGQGSHVSVPAKNDSASHKNRLNRIKQTLSVLSFNQSTYPEKTFSTKNVRVFYRVLQQEGDAFPTVYISDIRVVQRGQENVGGLYEYSKTQFGQQLSKSKNTNLGGKTVYISAAHDTAADAMKTAIYDLKGPVPALFFTPAVISQDLGTWKKPRISDSTKAVVKDLTELLQRNQRDNVNWHVAGEGAALLSQALARVSGSFEKHSFKFINARTNLAALLQELAQRKAQLQGEFLQYSRDNSVLLSIAQNSAEITGQLNRLPVGAGYDRITRRYLIEHFMALGKNGNAHAILKKATSIKGTNTTFIDAITLSRRGVK